MIKGDKKMNSIPNNPFLNRAMIQTEAAFIGREAEIRDILARVRSRESVSVVGEKNLPSGYQAPAW
jgi:hypothetical protein